MHGNDAQGNYNHVHFRHMLNIKKKKPILIQSSAHLCLPRFGPVQSGQAPHGVAATLLHLDPFTVKNEESKATLLKRCTISFPCKQTHTKKNPTTSQWVNEFTINLESQTKVIVVPAAWKKGRIMQLPKQIKESDHRSVQRKRGSDCSVRRSQSISSPSRDHRAANEPGDCLSTTHRDKRVWTKPPAE